jgi:hypothetical protein
MSRIRTEDKKERRETMIRKEDIEADYVDAPTAARMLDVSRSRVGKLCIAGRFHGAMKVGASWIIPREAVLNHKPLPPGVKPKAQRLAAEKAAILAQAGKVKEESA